MGETLQHYRRSLIYKDRLPEINRKVVYCYVGYLRIGLGQLRAAADPSNR